MNAMTNFDTVTTDATWIVKPLNSHFSSFGEAMHSYLNSAGYCEPHQKRINSEAVTVFCKMLGRPCGEFDTRYSLSPSMYFKDSDWLSNYLQENNYVRLGNGDFYKLDEYNRPIVYVNYSGDSERNVRMDVSGDEAELIRLRELVTANVAIDVTDQRKDIYYEIVINSSPFGSGEALSPVPHTIDTPRVATPEYYPYIEGGIVELIKNFMLSDEAVLILMGPPGTGKTSGVSAAIGELGLLPLYAKKTEVITNPKFVSEVFKMSDSYMDRVGGSKAKERRDLFTGNNMNDVEFHLRQKIKEPGSLEEEEVQKIPVVIVEDGDLLIAPRSQGNAMMAELLNETDGVGSNTTRKMIISTNLQSTKDIDEALIRPGRCYEVVHFRNLTPTEAVAARAAGGLPEFETVPTTAVSLATALRKPRKRILLTDGKPGFGFK